MARGSIERRERRDGSVVYDVRYDIDTPEGRRQRSEVVASLREAEALLNERLADRQRGVLLAPDKVTVAQAVETFLIGHGHEWREQTRRNRAVSARHVVEQIGSVRVQKLTAGDVRRCVAAWVKQGQAKSGMVKHLQLLRMVLDEAVADGVVRVNVAKLVQAGGRGVAPRVVWSEEQVAAFLRVTDAEDDAALWRLLATLGPRHGEVRALRWDDVDWEGRRVHIRRQIGARGSDAETKTAASVRWLPLSDVLMMQLRAWQDRQRLWQARAVVWEEPRRLFTTAYGRLLCEQVVNRRCHALCVQAGVPETSVHGLRHIAATSMAAAGVNPRVVQDLLGHATIATTLGVYSHVTGEMKVDAVAAVEARVR